MAKISVTKPSTWFSNKHFKLSLPRRRPKPTQPMSPPTVQDTSRPHRLLEVFRYFDGDGDGKISTEELRAFLASVGENATYHDVEVAIGDLALDVDNLLDFADFVRLMESDRGDDQDLRRAFEMFEIEKGSGCITPEGLRRMLNRLGDDKSYNECKAMIQVFDLDGNGVLDFQEFHRMMA